MSTKLEKSITRESTEQVDGREIIVTLTENQEVELKLKGLKSGTVRIPIRELYDQLVGEAAPKPTGVKATGDGPMISVNRLRSLNAITKSDVAVTAKIDSICVELLEEWKQENKVEPPKKKKKEAADA